MFDGIVNPPTPRNEPVRSYAPGTPERVSLEAVLQRQLAETVEIPAVIGGQPVHTGSTAAVVCPHDHGHRLAEVQLCGAVEVEQAIRASQEAWSGWSEMDWRDRAAVFLRAADLLTGPWRDRANAACMLGQSKTVYQSEIDAVCEMADFWRFNAHFLTEIYAQQPISPAGTWNQIEYRPLEGFVLAVTPFNFASIGGNLPTAPAMLGNTVLWKPATTGVLSGHVYMQILAEAGLPPGVINFLPGRGAAVGDPALASEHLAGIHFTGSTPTFQGMWRTVAGNLARYRTYPRLVGETGGKDFVFADPGADPRALVVGLVRGAFEYQGQKCSAASRAYVPASLWAEIEEELVRETAALSQGSPVDFRNFLAAVIDEPAFDTIAGFLEEARTSPDVEILTGGGADKSRGYFIEPTILRSRDPRSRTMVEEIFGPVLTVYVYEDEALDEALALCAHTSPYALTGAIFARDRGRIVHLSRALRHAAGNFYINDKPTGAVVGQQPFGGARASGTNDKAGSAANLLRWVSARAIKETFVPPTEIAYPHMGET